MKRITFADLVSVLQDSFDEDLTQYVDGDSFDIFDVASFNNLAFYLLEKIWDSYDPDSSNKDKIDTFYTEIEEARSLLNNVEISLDNWEELIDVGEED